MQDNNTMTPSHNDQQNPSSYLFAQCLYQAKDMPEFFRLYSDELMKLSENNPHALMKAGFVRSYASQTTNQYFLQASQEEYSRLQKVSSEIHPNLRANVEGRCKSVKAAFDKADKYIDALDTIHDIYAFRIVLYGPFSEQEQISFCYSLLDRVVKHYLSMGYILCKATNVSDVLDKESDDYKKLVTPTLDDRRLISWIPPDRYKDYIDTPKSNLYQSLHLALRAPTGFQFELQIRTFLMDVVSKEGDISSNDINALSHTNYKAKKYPNGVTFDRSQVHIPGYLVAKDPSTGKQIVCDTIGLEVPRPIISGISSN